jgi:DNA-binding winged helix-turn-helix (wHTH) protein
MLRFAGHEIDLGRKELRRGGEPVHVEPQVFDLLVHLIENRGRVVSKDELLDVVWNGRIVSEAALSSRINAARRALGGDGDRQEMIKTIHKRGFRFMGEVTEPEAAPAEEIEALTLVERAIELSPRDPHLTSFHHLRALAHFALGDLEAVVSCSRMAMRLQNASHSTFALHAAALGLIGRAETARATVEELLRCVPNYSCAYGRSDFFFCSDQAVVERFAEGLALVGLPETAAVASGTV